MRIYERHFKKGFMSVNMTKKLGELFITTFSQETGSLLPAPGREIIQLINNKY